MKTPVPARYSTGNRYVLLPDIRTSDCSIETLSFLHGGLRAAVELHGNDRSPFLEPIARVNGTDLSFNQVSWDLQNHWVPRFSLQSNGLRIVGTIFSPLEHKGFIWLLEIESQSSSAVHLNAGWKGCWQDTYHVVNMSKPMSGTRFGGVNDRCRNAVVVEFRHAAPMFAVAAYPGQEMETKVFDGHEQPDKVSGRQEVAAEQGQPICYTLTTDLVIEPGESRTLVLHFGVGPEETSAVAAAVDLHRHDWHPMLDRLLKWLDRRTYKVDDEYVSRLINLNSIYNYFYSQGLTIDTEQVAIVSSRSSRYHGSTSYKDRDAMLWTLPAVLQMDSQQARRMLEYAFTVQLRNVGLRSRFIDGIVLEPGFSLSALCAPVVALWTYVSQTGDMSIVFDRRIQTGINRIQKLLISAKHSKLPLYETMLSPSGEMARYPYMTYGNVLVWRMLRDLASMYNRIRDIDRTQETMEMANAVRKAILSHTVVQGPFGEMFAWSVDLEGGFDLNDEPAGSLQLLSWLEFCTADMPAYKNTVRWIHSQENPRWFNQGGFVMPMDSSSGKPSVLAAANDLLTGRVDEAMKFLKKVMLDDLIACESIDENTCAASSGLAFAAAAGFLSYALATSIGITTEAASAAGKDLYLTERLSPLPPEIRDSVD